VLYNVFMAKKTMTINLTENEMAVLKRLADERGLTKTALVRQSLRLYQQSVEPVKEMPMLKPEII